MGRIYDLNKRLDAIQQRHPANVPKIHRIVHEAHETVDEAIAASGRTIAPGEIVIIRKIVDVPTFPQV